jgi:hypothetical protein
MAVSICQCFEYKFGQAHGAAKDERELPPRPVAIPYHFESKDMKHADILRLNYPGLLVPAVPAIRGYEPSGAGLNGPDLDGLAHSLS